MDEGSDEEKAAVDPYFDYMMAGFRADDEANGVNGVVFIIDWDGFTLRNFNRPANIHENTYVMFFVDLPFFWVFF